MNRTRTTRAILYSALLGGSLSWSEPARAAEFFASTAAQISAAMQSAQPGDVITMLDGNWTNQAITLSGNGNAANPITLRAQTPGQVLLNGNSRLSINGNWLVVEGLRFEGGGLTSSGSVVQFGSSTRNSRFTNSAIIDYNPTSSIETDWVTMRGQDNRVDHNYFKGHNHIGQTLEVRHTAGTPDRHRIDNNYFADRQPGDGNGWETIRIGLSGVAQSSSHTIVENNLFERVDGENEAISNKSSHNIFRYNTFRDVRATLTLRHGNDATVEGNFFLGENRDGSGGVRVIGERHKLINNYFANIDDGGGGAIALNRGEIDVAPTGYQHVKDTVIAHNTFVNTLGTMIRFDAGASSRPLLPENVTVVNNLFRSNGPSIFTGTQGPGWTWEGNIAFGGSLGPKAGAAGITVVNPQLQLGPDGLWRPGPTSPAIDAASATYNHLVPTDMDGQARIGLFDIGADETSSASIVRRPLNPSDVGPGWLFANQPNPPYGGCNGFGCAIQAERFTAILDPDGDGVKWEVVSLTDALGGMALRAPAGTRIDLPDHVQETIAVYELIFPEEGTYTAYYRARGPNTSSDSIYAPADFNLDPANNIDLPEVAFGWSKDAQTFSISSAHVGVPVEFRLGMREPLAELDALVFTLNASMTPAQLDAMFVGTPGDFDGDGLVTAADYTVWRDSFGWQRSGLPADANQDGKVDEIDYAIWRTHFGTPVSPGGGGGGPNPRGASIPEPGTLALLAGGLVGLCLARRRT